VADVLELFRRSLDAFDARVDAVPDDRWDAPTPCTEWNVRDLVNHVAVEDLWVPEMLMGRTIGDVGDALEGDQLGEDPAAGWKRAHSRALEAAGREGALERTVHVSYGDLPGAVYLSHVGSDHVVHAWDLARAVGADEQLDDDLIDFVYEAQIPMVESARQAGVFGPELPVPDDADRQTKMLALLGRRA
jgi:uncharacterized protein (TIGR03086 family)